MLPASLSRWTFNLQTGLVVCVLAALLPVFALVSLASVKRQDESLARANQQLMDVAALATRGQQPALDSMRLSLGRLTEQPSSTNDDAKAVCRDFLNQAQGDAAPSVRLSLVNRSGTAVCHGRASPGAPLIDDAALGENFALAWASAARQALALAGAVGARAFEARDAPGPTRLYATSAVQGGRASGLQVLASMSRDDVVGPAQRDLMFQISFLVLLTAAGVLVARGVGRRLVVMPAGQLRQQIMDLAGLDDAGHVPLGRAPDDTNELTAAVQKTAERLAAINAGRDAVEADLRATLKRRADADAQLHSIQALLHMASKISRVGAWQVELPSMALTWSHQAYTIHDLVPDCALNIRDAIAFYAPEYQATIRQLFERCVATGEPFEADLEIITARRHRIWVRATGEAVRDAVGDITRVQGAVQDISQQKQAEARELSLANRLATTLETIGDGLVTLDSEWRFTYVNAHAEKLLQRPRSELLGSTLWQEFSDGLNPPAALQYREALQTREPRHFEAFYATPGLWLSTSVYPADEGLAVYFRDVTQRRAEHAQLELLTTAIARINDIVLITEAEPISAGPRIVYVNDAFERRTGYTREEVLGKSPKLLQGRKTSRQELDRIRVSLEAWKPVRSELVNYTKSGEEFWVEMDISPIADATGWYTHWVAVERDVTERRFTVNEILRLNSELEEKVIQRTAQLTALNKELEAFSYSVSHDLRAPLNTIDGFSLLLAKRDAQVLSEKGQHYLQRIRSGAAQMNELIDGLLVLAKSASEPLTRQAVDLSALARRIAYDCRERNLERQVVFNIQDGMTVSADALLMSVVLHNLIGNAWKFSAKTPAARIDVGCEMGDVGQPVYFVKDNGAGFDEAYADKLFGIFQRLHAADDYAGTGIGLVNVKRVIDRHGGTVWAHSRVDEGAAFYFTLG